MSWRLRKPDGTIYGPVSFSELYRWAAEGRILPGDAVAEGEGEWISAPDVAALELDWLLPRREGAIGPLHVLAYAEMLQQHMLQGSEPIVRKSGGDPIPVGQAVAAELLRQAERFRNELAISRAKARSARAEVAKTQEPQDAEAWARVESAERLRDDAQRERDRMREELTAARADQDLLRAQYDEARARVEAAERLRDDAQRERDRMREELTAARADQDLLRGQHDEARARAEAAERLRDDAERELDRLRTDLAGALADLQKVRGQLGAEQARAASLQDELTRATEQARQQAVQPKEEPDAPPAGGPEKLNATGREKEFQDLTRRYERMLARAREEAERNLKLEQTLQAEREAAARREAETGRQLRLAQEEAGALKARVEEQERLYQELVRDFRDLNERYIRQRDNKDPAAAKPKVRLA